MSEDEKIEIMGKVLSMLNIDAWMCVKDAMKAGGTCEIEDFDGEYEAFFSEDCEYVANLERKTGSELVRMTVLPEWVEAYKKHGREIEDARVAFDIIELYAASAAHLYGAVTLEGLMEVIRHYDPKFVLDLEATENIVEMRSMGPYASFWLDDGVIAYKRRYLPEDSDVDERLDELLESQREHERWFPPSRDELFRWKDPDYFEETPQTEALRVLFEDDWQLFDQDENTDMVACICDCAVAGYRMSEILSTVKNEFGMDFANAGEKTDRLLKAIAEVNNTLRMDVHAGHTPDEVGFDFLETPVRREEPKVGRNDPCPCGSGKKYKKCCGR